jgi:hypothetical protein
MIKAARRFFAVSAVAALTLAVWSASALAVDAPKWVAALHIEAQNAVGLRWLPVPGATGYKVLRSTTPGSGYQEIAAPAAPQHFDTAIAPGNTYYYVLQAVAGAEASPNSAEKSIPVVAKVVVKPDAPRWNKVSVDNKAKAIRLEWLPVNGAVAYNIYRRESFKPAGKEDLVASVASADPYMDKSKLKKNIEYIYMVSVLDGSFVESDKGAPKKIKFSVKVAKKATKKEEKVVDNRPVELLGELTYVLEEGEKIRGQIMPVGSAVYDDEVYVYYLHQVIQVFESDGKFKRRIVASEGTFPSQASSIFIDDEGLYLVESRGSKVWKYDHDGTFRAHLDVTLGSDPANPLDKQRIKPTRINVAPGGDYWVNDANNNVFRIFSPELNFLERWGVPGHKDGEFSLPEKIYFTKDGGKVVVDGGNFRVQVFDGEGKFLRAFGEPGQRMGQFGLIAGSAFDLDKNLIYISDNAMQVIHVGSIEKGEIVGIIKFADAETKRRFSSPISMTFADGVLYIVNAGEHTVLAVEESQ